MGKVLDLSAQKAREYLLDGGTGEIRVRGLIDLRKTKLKQLTASISCHDLDASDSQL